MTSVIRHPLSCSYSSCLCAYHAASHSGPTDRFPDPADPRHALSRMFEPILLPLRGSIECRSRIRNVRLMTSSHMVRMDPTSGPSACILGLSHRDSQDGSLGIDALLARDRLAREGVFMLIGSP